MLNAHMDVVGAGGMTEPWTPRIDGTRLYGRGAYDMKASLAAIMLAGREAARLELRGDVIVTAVADEEFASIGVQDVVRRMGADAAIVTEPTGLDLCVAHKGFVWLEVETHGVASHGSLPEEGVDAIAKMGPVLTGLATSIASCGRGPATPARPILGPCLAHPGWPGAFHLPRPLSALDRAANNSRRDERRSKSRSRLFSPGRRGDPRSRPSSGHFSCATRSASISINRSSTSHDGTWRGHRPGAGDRGSRRVDGFGVPCRRGHPDGDLWTGRRGRHADVEWVDLVSATRTGDALLGIIAEFCA